jgi:hypothetical protein
MITYREANEIEQQRFKIGTAPAVPSTLYLMLSSTAISADGTGATEPSGGSYTRVAITSSSSYWSTPSNGRISNLTKLDFPQATSDWGTMTYVALTDASTGVGNIRYYQALTRPKIIQQDDVASFAIGALVVQIGN